ncbi:sunset domain-containing protein [Shimia thalassica]|uniref:sunset domain-containing protein n=1 Tax=Shimia thalassica TaxID=1715693 RepID=UPI003F7400BF
MKGNISSKGARIYHMPGTKWYSRTKISERYGERWFCSEADARNAGWRRAR